MFHSYAIEQFQRKTLIVSDSKQRVMQKKSTKQRESFAPKAERNHLEGDEMR